ncbi:hypothetical protein [Thermotoga caldifontis]|uniref:hypothetical protein n=1 Tax=Thermotoga caldifontis TaxID=1508419 RepID=UPI0005970BC6|nr:hypothetical protein [Thermotoga caldifontis]
MQEQDERILNLLRLKEEMEKELKKKGILRERRTEVKKQPEQLKIELEPEIDLPVEKIWSVHDLNHFAYGVSDDLVQRSLQKRLHTVRDEEHRSVLVNLIKLLRKEKLETLGRSSVHLESLRVLSELYSMNPDVIKDTIQLLKNYPAHALTYITAAEVFLAFGKFIEAAKLFQVYVDLSRDPYAQLVLEAYRDGQIDSSTFASCVSKDGYKSMLLIVSALVEAEEKLSKVAAVLEKRNFACAQYVSAMSAGRVTKLFPHCSRLLIYNEALKFIKGEEVNQTLLEQITTRDPMARLVLASVNLRNDPAKSFEHMRALLNSVGEIFYVEVNRENKPPLIRNVIEPRRFPKDFKIVSKEEELEGLLRTLSSSDVRLFFKDPEYLRLYFGERHCKNTCFWEGWTNA